MKKFELSSLLEHLFRAGLEWFKNQREAEKAKAAERRKGNVSIHPPELISPKDEDPANTGF